ncbi:MAG: PDZ domain-containing protein [Candidatus Omnitrophota bacterium]
MKYALALLFIVALTCQVLRADTILLRDGQELKGVIVEDYHDRVVISTEKGEIGAAKNNIDKISYDSADENLVKLGAFYKDRGDYKLALHYYESARKINPDLKEAREGSLLVTNMMMNKKEADVARDIAMRQDTEENMGRPQPAEQLEINAVRKGADELWSAAGISIEKAGSDVEVAKVMNKSPAYEAGMRPRDTIVSIWGKLIKYMPLENVYDLFLSSKVSEIRVTIAREESAAPRGKFLFGGAEDIIGARLSMELDGLTVSEVRTAGPFDDAGILKDDRITKINAASTRYMPLESFYKMIEDIKGKTLKLEIQREITLWRK